MFDITQRNDTAVCSNCMSFFYITAMSISNTICKKCQEVEIERRRRLNSNKALPRDSIMGSSLFNGISPYNNSPRIKLGFLDQLESEEIFPKTIKLNKKLLLL